MNPIEGLPLSDLTLTAVQAEAVSRLRNHPELREYGAWEWTAVLTAALANVIRELMHVAHDDHGRAELVRSLVAVAADAALWVEALEGNHPQIRG